MLSGMSACLVVAGLVGPPRYGNQLDALLAAARADPLLVCHRVDLKFARNRVLEWEVWFADSDLSPGDPEEGGFDQLKRVRQRRLDWGGIIARRLTQLSSEQLTDPAYEKVNPAIDCVVYVHGFPHDAADQFFGVLPAELPMHQRSTLASLGAAISARWRGGRLASVRQPVERVSDLESLGEEVTDAARSVLRRVGSPLEARDDLARPPVFRAVAKINPCEWNLGVAGTITCTNISDAPACLPRDVTYFVCYETHYGLWTPMERSIGCFFEPPEDCGIDYVRVEPGGSLAMRFSIDADLLVNAGAVRDNQVVVSFLPLFREFLIEGDITTATAHGE